MGDVTKVLDFNPRSLSSFSTFGSSLTNGNSMTKNGDQISNSILSTKMSNGDHPASKSPSSELSQKQNGRCKPHVSVVSVNGFSNGSINATPSSTMQEEPQARPRPTATPVAPPAVPRHFHSRSLVGTEPEISVPAHGHSKSLTGNQLHKISLNIVEGLIEVIVFLGPADKRFGFSVVGGSKEKFTPRIDEIAHGSPADKADLEVGDEILEVNGRSLENASHTEVISHIHKCIRSRTICLRVKRRTGDKIAAGLADTSNVQDAFVIAIEQRARERLERLSALKRIQPIDMTKLSSQLSDASQKNNSPLDSQGRTKLRTSSNSSEDLNSVLDSSPIYVTSIPNLTSALSSGSSQKAAKTRSVVRPSSGVQHKSSKSSSSRSSPQETKTSSRRHHQRTRTKVATDSGDADGSKSGDELELKHDLREADIDTPLIDLSSEHTNQETVNHSTAESGFDPSAGELTCDSRSDDLEDGLSDDSLPEKPNTQLNLKTAELQQEVLLDPPTYSHPTTNRGALKRNTPDTKDFNSSRKNRGNKDSAAANIPGRQTQGADPAARTPSPFNNMISMVELNTANKDRAIDVPESFVARTKTPPRYPPPPKLQQRATENSQLYNNNHHYSESGKAKDTPPSNGGLHRSVLLAEQIQSSTSEAEASRIKKYEEDLMARRREREEQTADWQRTSIRESEKLRALATSVPLRGMQNDAFDTDESYAHSHLNSTASTEVSVGVDELVTSLQHIQTVLKSNSHRFGVNMTAVNNLLGNREFQNVLAIQNKVQDKFCARRPPSPATSRARHVVDECMEYLKDSPSPAAIEMASLLSSHNVDGIIFAHDSIAERYVAPILDANDLQTLEPHQLQAAPRMYSSPPPPLAPPVLLEQNDDPSNVRLVRIDKTNEPLGATIRHDDESAETYQPIIIGRIVRGGAAEKCGRLNVGDEILEVNGVDVRGKTIHEVCDMLAGITGTLSFIIAPRGPSDAENGEPKVMHVKAHFDYDPEEDPLNPCKEMAISIQKGDILRVVDQADPKWWQARRDGDPDQSLAGLIPSKAFQQQREAERQNVVEETVGKEKSKKGKLLCAKKTHKKKNKQLLYPSYKEEGTAEILTYEEVDIYYPNKQKKRPVVLIGPPNIGRHELRQKLMEDTERFAAAVPHTSRTRMDGEVDGQDYHFITRVQFETMILARRFVEHGEYERSYYGTSIDAIRHVVFQEKICVLNLTPLALETLRMSDLKPYVVLVAPPALEKLRHRVNAAGQPFKEEELKEIIEKAREMEDLYGHYFDQVIINQDLDRTYASLMQHITLLERNHQWVPAAWLKEE